MKIVFKKNLFYIKNFFHSLLAYVEKGFRLFLEEIKSIARNRKYAIKYPKLFAIFSIIEHEQSSQVFELNYDDFSLIKNEILCDDKVNNHHILEAIRNIFQNVNFLGAKNKIQDEILEYIYEELLHLIKNSNSYYDPLIKAILRGFPLLLNYKDYEIIKIFLQQRSNKSLRMLKYILENENFLGIFIKEEDLIEIILHVHQINNKAAFMLFTKYLRKNNLFDLIFIKNISDIKNKIISAHSFAKRNIDYSAILLAYYDDKWLINEKKIEKVEQFLREIFSHNLGLNQAQKLENYGRIKVDILQARHLKYNNFLVEKILNEISNRYIDQDNLSDKKNNIKFKFISIARNIKPSSHVEVQELIIVTKISPEENWLQKHAPYLLLH